MPEKFGRKKTKKAGAAVEEEHLLSIVDICDNVSIIQVDIEAAYVLASIASINYGFRNLTDNDIIPDLETPTKSDDKEVFKWKASCSSKASLQHKGHEDHNKDVEPSMRVYEDNDVEVDYEFHNDAAFVQIELGLEETDVEEVQGLSQIRPTLQALNLPNMWIGDTGATKHSTKHKQGEINSRPSTSRTKGIYGQAVKPSMEVDLPGMYCDKSGEDQFVVKLRNVDVIPESHYNLISIMKLLEEDHKMTGNKKDGITVEKGTQVIIFDIRVKTPKGVLWCAYIKRPESNREITAGMSNNKSINQPKGSVQELTPEIKMNIERAHAILGHSSEETTWRTAAALGMGITRGTLKTCKSCAIAKAKQKNLNNESEGRRNCQLQAKHILCLQ
jgi:hypothetical protein